MSDDAGCGTDAHYIADLPRCGLSSRQGLGASRDLLADLSVLATAAAVAGLFAVSPAALDSWGIAYMTPGGGALSKFHPATLIALGALVLRCLGAPRPLRTGWRLATGDEGVVLLLAGVAIAALYAATISRTPITPLVDTFALPVLVFLQLRDLDSSIMRWLAVLIAVVLCANAVIAIIEFVQGWHLLSMDVSPGASSDPTRGDATFDWRAQLALDWRATALLGHPLANGLIVGSFVLCLVAQGARWLPFYLKAPLLLLQLASLFAFGARIALVLTIAFGGWSVVKQGIEALGRGARFRPRQMATTLIVLVLGVGAGAILLRTGFFDHTIERFQDDGGSATTRITMFNLFRPISLGDILFGPDPDLVATWQRLEGLEFGIESSWVGLVLTYGLVVTTILTAGLFAFTRSVVRACGHGAVLMLTFYFILVSASTELSGKTTTFAMAVILSLVYLRKSEHFRPEDSMAHVRLV